MQTLLQNLRFTLRMLRKNPGLTITVLLTLALGIGANTAIFTVDYATLLAPLPYPHPEQIVMVWSKIKTYHNGVSAGDFTDWKRQATVFSDLDAWTGAAFNIATHEQPEYVQGTRATTGFLRVLGSSFQYGRGFLPEEGVAGREHVGILTLWLLLGAVGFILLIACANVANLLLAKGMTQQKEVAIRSALGATRRTVFVQLLTEAPTALASSA